MNEDERILDKLKKVLGEEFVADMSAEELKPFLDNPEMLGGLSALSPATQDVAAKSFEDYCPDVMKNPVTAKWIEKEGDKARVFAVKMAGIADNPNVSDELKRMIASPEGLVDLYHRVDAKAAHMDDVMRRYGENQTNLEELKKLEVELFDPKNNAYVVLIENDRVVLNPHKHWEQCYSMGKSGGQTTLDVLTEEAHDYHKKAVVAAEKKAVREVLAKLREKDKTSPTKAKRTVHKSAVAHVHSMVGYQQRG